ncbi:hypothetical protein HBI47_058690 [Parastagonospora nodorum]|nr:hypothetical protein HBI47_058690 [Parastagonospora nodorum]
MYTSAIVSLLLLAPGVLAQRTSTDATCGGKKGYTCLNSAWGSCCSQYGWCGSKPEYCGKGCNPGFGTCNKLSAASSSIVIKPTQTPAVPVSTNARCGSSFGGRTCQGSQWGNCCSQYSWCGSTKDHCDAKTCQKKFGQCNGQVASSKSSSTLATFIKSSPSTSPSSTPSKSSSTPSTSSTTSSSPSTSPTPKPCYQIPPSRPCGAYTGPLDSASFYEACPSPFSNYCVANYQAFCYGKPSSDSTQIRSFSAGVADCKVQCDQDAACVGLAFQNTQSQTCTLYSSIKSITAGDRTDTVFRQVCPSTGQSSTLSPSSLASSTVSSSSASSTVSSSSSPSSSAVSTPAPTDLPVSRDGTCGASAGSSCSGSAFGACCGADSFCGLGSSCGAGCQPAFGLCASPSPISSSETSSPTPTPTPTPTPSPTPETCFRIPSTQTCTPYTDPLRSFSQSCKSISQQFCTCNNYYGTCYATVSADSTIIAVKQHGENADSCSRACDQDSTCVGFAFNDSSAQYCTLYSEIRATGEGTYVDYVFRKTCPTASSSSVVVMPTPRNLPISSDGTCGATPGFSCLGSRFGACCGADGFCGLGAACAAGCQADYGLCQTPTCSAGK